jgi:hypothetical protein
LADGGRRPWAPAAAVIGRFHMRQPPGRREATVTGSGSPSPCWGGCDRRFRPDPSVTAQPPTNLIAAGFSRTKVNRRISEGRAALRAVLILRSEHDGAPG